MKRIQRVLSVIIALTMIVGMLPAQVFAEASQGTDYSDLTPNQYMAKVILNHNYSGTLNNYGKESQTPHQSLYEALYYNPEKASSARIIYNEFKDANDIKTLQGLYELLTFNPSSLADDVMDLEDYYTAILLSIVDAKISDDNFIDDLNCKANKNILTLSKNISNILKASSGAEYIDLSSISFNDLSLEESGLITEICINDAYSKDLWNKVGKDIGIISNILYAGENLNDAIKNINNYASLATINAATESVLLEIYNNCPDDNLPMKNAAKKVYEYVSEKMTSEILTMIELGEATFDVGYKILVSKFWSSCLTAVLGELAIGVLIGQAIGGLISNYCFATDAVNEQLVVIGCMVEFEDVMVSAVDALANKYKSNESEENADSYMRSLQLLLSTYDLGCDYLKDFIELVYTGGVVSNIKYGNSDDLAFWRTAIPQRQGQIRWETVDFSSYSPYYKVDAPSAYEQYFGQEHNEEINITGMTVTQKQELNVGDEGATYNFFSVAYLPANHTEMILGETVSSSDDSVIRVDNNNEYIGGYLTVVGEGICTLTFTTYDKKHSASAEVTVGTDIKDEAGPLASDFAEGDEFTFGVYPQSRVTDSALVSNLESLEIVMFDNTTGLYGDVIYNGDKYRKITILHREIEYETGINSAYKNGGTYWFKWEPITWVVIGNEADGLNIISKEILDTHYVGSTEWEDSAIREWLNYEFYFDAFNQMEQGKINTTTTINDIENEYGINGGANTTDKLRLLSLGEAEQLKMGEVSYPYNYDPGLTADCTEYAKSQGLLAATTTDSRWCSGKSWWVLRTPGANTKVISYVDYEGHINEDSKKFQYIGWPIGLNSLSYSGIRPAITINFNAVISQNHTYTVHDFNYQWIKPSCIKDGLESWSCTVCGYCITKVESATGHNYQYVEYVPPTCTTTGYTVYWCTNCRLYSYHDWEATISHQDEYVKTVPPTCTEKGYDLYRCSVCGEESKHNIVNAAHNYVVVNIIAASCLQGGYTNHKCSACGDSKTSDHIAALGHNGQLAKTVLPTCTEKGYDVYNCERCDHAYNANEVEALGHNFVDGSCDNCGAFEECIGISIKTQPTKTEYWIGESLNIDGLTLSASYSGGSTRTVTEGFTVSSFSSTSAGTKTITVTYEGKTATFTVTVKEVVITGITIKTQPAKTEYWVGENLSTDGLSLTAAYSDGSTRTVADGFTVSGFSSTSAGTKTITVTYEGKTATFTVTVKEAVVTGITIKTQPVKTEYWVDEKLNTDGLTLTTTYSDGSTRTVTEGFTVSGFNSESAGTRTITVTYEGKTVAFTITVKEATLTGIAIKTQPAKTEYWVGEKLSTDGLSLTAAYSDGSTRTVTDGFTVSGFSSTSAGTKTLTVTYGDKTVTFEVFVSSVEIVESGVCGSNLTWKLDNSGTLTVSGTGEMAETLSLSYPWDKYKSSIKAVVVDSGVTTIGYQAFGSCKNLTTVTIGDGVRTIGRYAFAYCDNLKSVIIGNGIETIMPYAFDCCNSLSYNVYDNGLYLGNTENPYLVLIEASSSSIESCNIYDDTRVIAESAFSGCSNLTSVTIPNGITSIGDNAFWNCDSLTYNTFDNGLYLGNAEKPYLALIKAKSTDIEYCNIHDDTRVIAQNAFSDCNSLCSVVIPNNVVSIGTSAFYSCDNLATVTIGAGVRTVGSSAFGYCNSLTEINIPDNVIVIEYSAFSNCDSLTTANIGNGVKVISNSAFYSCDNLTTLIIGDSVEFIGIYAFEYCNSLVAVNIPNSVTTIEAWAFACCDKLTTVTIGNGVTTIGENAFYDCYDLLDVYISDPNAWCRINFENNRANPAIYTEQLHFLDENGNEITDIKLDSSVSAIPCDAFRSSSITSITIPDSVTGIGSAAFYDCDSLTTVRIGNRVESIGQDAFHNCKSLTAINISDSVTSIGLQAFFNCRGLTTVNIGNGVETIGDSAFYYCDSLTAVTIGTCVKTIGSSAFSYCKSLVEVNIPDSVELIGGQSFYGCESLTTVNIGDGVTSIGDRAFSYCAFTDITIPSTVTMLGEGVFTGNDNIGNVRVAAENEVFSSVDGVLFNKEQTEILYYPKAKEYASYTIPSSVTKIANKAFYGCKLDSIVIPDSVVEIGDSAFADSTDIDKLVLGSGVKHIGNSAFAGCWYIFEIILPEGLLYIGDNAFYECAYADWMHPAPLSISIPKSVEHIGEGAFSGSECLVSISVDEGNLYYCSADGILYTKDKTRLICYPNGKEAGIFVIPAGVQTIGKNAFHFCSDLRIMVIPDSLKEICEGNWDGNNGKPLHILYAGSAEQWNEVIIDDWRTNWFTEGTCHYSSSLEQISSSIVNPTCTEQGYTKYTCSLCNEEIQAEYTNALGHNGEVIEVIAPTCTESGYTKYRCTVCDATYNGDWVYSTGHNKGAIIEVINPTCEDWGYTIYQCDVCDETFEGDWTEDLGGVHTGTEIEVVLPTCTDYGYTKYHCTVCDSDYKDAWTEPLGHNAVVVSVVDPSCVELGYTEYECSVCAELYKDDMVSPVGHTFANDVCTSCSKYKDECIESPHNYENSCDETWVISKPNADRISITFSSATETESYYDYIYIYDIDDNLIGKYSGTELASKKITVNGNTVKIRLTSDSSVSRYGFAISDIVSYIVLEDDDIEISVPESSFDSETVLRVDDVAGDGIIASIPSGFNRDAADVFDIYFEKDNQRVQPSDDVTVYIPVPLSKDGTKCKVFHIDDSGNTTDMNAVYENGYMVFETNHFSYYVLVEETDCVIGDVNGDGVVDTLDRMALNRYLANWEGYTAGTINMTAADINGDTVVDTLDRMMLNRYLANWEGYETLSYSG